MNVILKASTIFYIFFIPAAFVTQMSAVPKEEASVNLNHDLGSRSSKYVSIVEGRSIQNRDYPPPSSTYISTQTIDDMPTIDDSWASSIRISIIILVGLCILLMILYAASFGIKLRETEHEPHLIQLEARDNYYSIWSGIEEFVNANVDIHAYCRTYIYQILNIDKDNKIIKCHI